MVTSLSAGYNAACQRDTDPKHAIKPKITLISETSPVLSVLLKNILSCGVLPSPAKSACIAGGTYLYIGITLSGYRISKTACAFKSNTP